MKGDVSIVFNVFLLLPALGGSWRAWVSRAEADRTILSGSVYSERPVSLLPSDLSNHWCPWQRYLLGVIPWRQTHRTDLGGEGRWSVDFASSAPKHVFVLALGLNLGGVVEVAGV